MQSCYVCLVCISDSHLLGQIDQIPYGAIQLEFYVSLEDDLAHSGPIADLLFCMILFNRIFCFVFAFLIVSCMYINTDQVNLTWGFYCFLFCFVYIYLFLVRIFLSVYFAQKKNCYIAIIKIMVIIYHFYYFQIACMKSLPTVDCSRRTFLRVMHSSISRSALTILTGLHVNILRRKESNLLIVRVFCLFYSCSC